MKKYYILISLIILIDQLLKHISQFKTNNYGASFNILSSNPIILIVISISAIIFFLVLFYKTKADKLALSLLISGAMSNLIDRIFLGYIIDYIRIPYLFSFNLADLSNTTGLIILIMTLWRK